MSHVPSSVTATPDARILRQILLGLTFLGAIAVLSLPGARGAGIFGWMPLWLLATPLAGLLALALAGLRDRAADRCAADSPGATARRRGRPVQARRRPSARPGAVRHRPQSPAAA